MGVKDAAAGRFQSLCREAGISCNELAVRSGVTPSTVYSMMDPKRRNLSLVTVKLLCDGLNITLQEFFSGEEFQNLEQELQ